MTQIKLLNMKIRNFKGVKEYNLDADGSDLNIFGDNGTGKTTLYDAFLWCLFGKDSKDQSDTKFDWKPLTEDNEPIHHLETEVVVTLEVGSKEKTLGRLIKEKWTKKRGAIEAEFDGHTTTYSLDGLEVKQKEYKAFLDGLIGEETFKLLTNVNYFPETLDWKERRQILIEMVGGVSIEDIIKANNNLKPLYSLLAERDIDDNLKLTKQQMAAVNKQIKEIPDRIDEVDRSLPDLTDLDKTDLEQRKDKAQKEITAKDEEIISIRNGNGIDKLRLKIQELNNQYQSKSIEFERSNSSADDDIKKDISAENEVKRQLQDELYELESEQRTHSLDVEEMNRKITRLSDENETGREKFYELQKEQMDPFDEHMLACPTCERAFEQGEQESIRTNYEAELESFNLNKAEKLQKIQEKGISNNQLIEQIKEDKDSLGDKINSFGVRIAGVKVSIDQAELRIEGLNKKANEIKSSKPKFENSDEASSIKQQIADIDDQISNEQENFKETIEVLENEKRSVQLTVNEVNDKLYRFELYDKQNLRKGELVEEEQSLSLEYGKLEQRLYLLEEFVKTKVDLLTDTINSKFDVVKFKLFDTAINGGLIEVCEPTVNGANYSTGLNNAARINAGLDIISTLMGHYDIHVPVWVDNSESVNELVDIDTQLITLSVSNHKNLRVEVPQ